MCVAPGWARWTVPSLSPGLAPTGAEALKLHARIAVGRCGCGSRLPPMRTGAVFWGTSRIRLGSGSRISLGRGGTQWEAMVPGNAESRVSPALPVPARMSGVLAVLSPTSFVNHRLEVRFLSPAPTSPAGQRPVDLLHQNRGPISRTR